MERLAKYIMIQLYGRNNVLSKNALVAFFLVAIFIDMERYS